MKNYIVEIARCMLQSMVNALHRFGEFISNLPQDLWDAFIHNGLFTSFIEVKDTIVEYREHQSKERAREQKIIDDANEEQKRILEKDRQKRKYEKSRRMLEHFIEAYVHDKKKDLDLSYNNYGRMPECWLYFETPERNQWVRFSSQSCYSLDVVKGTNCIRLNDKYFILTEIVRDHGFYSMYTDDNFNKKNIHFNTDKEYLKSLECEPAEYDGANFYSGLQSFDIT